MNATMNRLETLSVELNESLRLATLAKQRAASLVAAEFAVNHAKVEDIVVSESLACLRAGNDASPEIKAKLERLIAQLDDEYFALLEANEEGQAAESDCLKVFGRARAVAALLYAFTNDPFEAVAESVYEAAAATGDLRSLLAAVEAVVR